MTAWRLLPLLLLLLLLAACAGGRTPPDAAAPPDDTERLLRLAEAQAQAGEHAEAVRLFEEVMRNQSSGYAARALLGLTRSLCDPEYPGRDYLRAYLAADRLVREYPDSQHTGEARAWRDLLVAYLARGQERDRHAIELEQLLLERERHTGELERLRGLDLELERRTHELQRRTQEVDRLKQVDLELERRTLELERRSKELERRTQELEQLKRLDLDLEQRKRKP